MNHVLACTSILDGCHQLESLSWIDTKSVFPWTHPRNFSSVFNMPFYAMQIVQALADMRANVQKSGGFVTIGLTCYPPYPNGAFPYENQYIYQNGGDWTWFGARMVQNLIREGAEVVFFIASSRVYINAPTCCTHTHTHTHTHIHEHVRRHNTATAAQSHNLVKSLHKSSTFDVLTGMIEDAIKEITPMIDRVCVNKDFREWYGQHNDPQGSTLFHGGAGELATAIKMLQKIGH